MASTINATSTGSGGLISTGNSVNQLELQTGDTTRVVIDSSGNVTIQGQGDLRLADSDSSHYVALQAPGTVSSNVTFTLPSADGTNGQVLQTNGSGTLSFATPSAGAMTLVSTLTASSSSSLSWTGLTSDKYMIIIERMYTSTGADLFLQFGYGSTTWVTSNYFWYGPYGYVDSTGSDISVGKISSFAASSTGFYPLYYMSNVANPANMCVMQLGGLQSGVSQMHTATSQSNFGGSTRYYYTSTSGATNIANAITGIRLIPNSGNIVNGTASLYAITS